MHSAATFTSLILAATAAFASPLERRQAADTEVRVILQNQGTETGSQTVFPDVSSRQQKPPIAGSEIFKTIEISVGAGAQQDLRCQALDAAGVALVATRGENTDVTFSDADKGAWTFVEETSVARVVCDPAFVAVGPEAFEVRVQLATSDLATQTVFADVTDRVELYPTGSSGPFETVEIILGELVDPALRCQVLNKMGKPIVAIRGENVDKTFSDADKGEWTFKNGAREVSQVICDPAFVARPQ